MKKFGKLLAILLVFLPFAANLLSAVPASAADDSVVVKLHKKAFSQSQPETTQNTGGELSQYADTIGIQGISYAVYDITSAYYGTGTFTEANYTGISATLAEGVSEVDRDASDAANTDAVQAAKNNFTIKNDTKSVLTTAPFVAAGTTGNSDDVGEDASGPELGDLTLTLPAKSGGKDAVYLIVEAEKYGYSHASSMILGLPVQDPMDATRTLGTAASPINLYPKSEVETGALYAKKTSFDGDAINGAQFVIQRLSDGRYVSGSNDGIYTPGATPYTFYSGKTYDPSDTDPSGIAATDAAQGMLIVKGLSPRIYRLEETQSVDENAGTGYEKGTAEIVNSERYKYFEVKVDGTAYELETTTDANGYTVPVTFDDDGNKIPAPILNADGSIIAGTDGEYTYVDKSSTGLTSNDALTIKNDTASVEKTAAHSGAGKNDSEGYDVGSDVDFTITVDVPYGINDNTTTDDGLGGTQDVRLYQKFNIEDAYSKGLELQTAANAQLEGATLVLKDADGAVIDDNVPYTINTTDAPQHVSVPTGGGSFILAVDGDYVNDGNLEPGGTLTLTYKMTLTDQAAMNGENSNEANVDNGHIWVPQTKIPHVDIETGGYNFQKVDANKESKTLSGAEFLVTRTVQDGDGNDQLEYLSLEGYEGKDAPTSGLYNVSWVTDTTDATTYVSGTAGKFTVLGLAEGDYQLLETKAPEGYAISKDSDNLGFTVELRTTTSDTFLGKITNVTKGILPTTGGKGILLLIVVGLVLVGSAVYYFRKRRETSDM